MVTLATGSLADLGFGLEETYGEVPPSPSLTVFRRVNGQLNLKKDSYQSEEIRSDRMTSDLRHGVRRIDSEIETEFSVDSYDEAIEALMGGTWTAGVAKSEVDFTSVAADSGSSTFTFAAGAPVTEGLRIGDVIQFSNLSTAANNGVNYTITGFSGTSNRVLTVYPAPTTMSADTSFDVEVVGYKVNIGNTYRSFFFERAFTDISQYGVYKGNRFNSLNLQLPPTGIVKATWGLKGQDMDPLSTVSLDSSYTAAPTNSPLASVDGVLFEGGSLIGIVTGFNFSINNNLDGKPVVGQNIIPNMLYGTKQQVTGEITVLFENATMFNKFVNETESSLILRLNDINGTDFINIVLNRIKYSGADIADADDGGLPISMPFTALAPTSSNSNSSLITFQKSNA